MFASCSSEGIFAIERREDTDRFAVLDDGNADECAHALACDPPWIGEPVFVTADAAHDKRLPGVSDACDSGVGHRHLAELAIEASIAAAAAGRSGTCHQFERTDSVFEPDPDESNVVISACDTLPALLGARFCCGRLQRLPFDESSR
jgi:hypothetical protein